MPPTPRPPTLRYVAAVDLGQSQDPSAAAVLEVRDFQELSPERKRLEEKRGFAVVHLQRWPLGTAYLRVADDLAKLMKETPVLCRADLIVDASGCGRPVLEMLEGKGIVKSLRGVVITAGLSESYGDDGIYRVSKAILISTMQVMLQTRTILFAEGLSETKMLVKELEGYKTCITPAANQTWSAREGEHDDLVLAVCLAAWWAKQLPAPPGRTGSWDARPLWTPNQRRR